MSPSCPAAALLLFLQVLQLLLLCRAMAENNFNSSKNTSHLEHQKHNLTPYFASHITSTGTLMYNNQSQSIDSQQPLPLQKSELNFINTSKNTESQTVQSTVDSDDSRTLSIELNRSMGTDRTKTINPVKYNHIHSDDMNKVKNLTENNVSETTIFYNQTHRIDINKNGTTPQKNDLNFIDISKAIENQTVDFKESNNTNSESNRSNAKLNFTHTVKTVNFNHTENPIILNSLVKNSVNDERKINFNNKKLEIKPTKKLDATENKTENGNCSNSINFTKEILQCLDTTKNTSLEKRSKKLTTDLSTTDKNTNHQLLKTMMPTINKSLNLKTKPIKDYVLSYSSKRFSKRNKSFQKPVEDSTLTSNQYVNKRTSSRFMTRSNETNEKRFNARGRKSNVASRFIEFLPKTAAVRLPDHGTGPMQKRAVVSLLGLFELSTRQGERPEGRSELAAAKLAVKHINDKKLLPGYTLELLTNDTQCDPGVGVDRFFHALYTQKSTRMVMLLGSACSEVTESLAKVVPYWNMVQVSFGSTSPALSDRSEFPLFYRTVAPDSSHNPARIAFVQRFGWDSVAALSQNEDAYSLALNDLVTELERANITCTATITFAETDLREQLRVLKDLDTRIIIGSFSHEVAPKIFCEAYQLGMFGADYAWIVHGNGASTWWMNATDCPRHQLADAVEGLILVSSHNSIVGTQPSYSGLTNEEFALALQLGEQVPVSKYAPQTYDAVWAIALALSNAEADWSAANTTVGHFDYTRRDMATEFLQQLGQLNFLGISGPVSFSGADRVGTSAFHQVQGELVRTVALYYPSNSELDFSCPGCEPLRWQGGQVPIARRVIKLRIVTIPPAAFLAVSSLAVVGISLALAFLAFNLHFRKLKSIKLSSPRLNNMTVVGCILVYVAVILLGLDHATLRVTDHFSTICTLRVYLLSAGFSLAFGSMFTKTYRVHRIFIRSRSGVVKDKLLQDTQLISLICVLLLIDVLIVTLWVVIDPMQRHLRNLSLEISAADRSVVYQPQVEVCRSQNTNGWLGALYAYKSLLLIVGVYMAWETRHVKIPALNDSQYIGMSVYSVVITSGIFVVLANLMSDRATLAFVTMTTFILISTTTTLCLLFLPTLHAILKRADNCDPVVQSMGLKIECNTRRFVTDDRRELQYRVEIQNKVYRREVAALDLEIGRLEKQLLEMNSVSCSSSTSSLAAKKMDMSPAEDSIQRDHPRIPSIGGGLPLLLLSVLPPVIPRASWPSAVQELPMRRSVTFCSEPKLDDQHSARRQREPAIDLYNLCLRPERFNEKVGVFGRLKNLLGSRPSIRKSSTASYAGNSNVGIAGALKAHMGYIAGLVPGTNKTHMASSCNTSSIAIHKLDGSVSAKDLYSRRQSFARAGGSGPIISVTSDSDMIDDDDSNDFRRKFSLGLCLAKKDDTGDTSKVNFSIPLQKRKSITHQHSQPVLSFRERARGSPRFPHKIVPTCSLNALEDRRKSSSSTSSHQLQQQQVRRSSQQPASLFIHTNPKKLTSLSQQTATKWRSMEDASSTTLPGSRRGSGVLAISCLPSSAGFQPRAASYSPNCDVWSTAEFGIPFSELGKNYSSPCHGKLQHEAMQ